MPVGSIASVQRALFRWFKKHQRDLPWRHTHDPYRILVSEVMLQQTQVDRVIPKYRAFLKVFPTVRALARATPRDALLAWAGMGYNRRAVYLLRAAREIVARHGGRVPTDRTRLQALPGVGAYTAAAVATFATGVPHALADTNVKRVIGRVFGGHPLPRALRNERAFLALVARTMPQARVIGFPPSLWGHALMDLGALVCRAKPRCAVCPLRQWCKAYPTFQRGSVGERERGSSRFPALPLPRPPARPVPDRLLRGALLRRVREADPRPVTLRALQRILSKQRQRDLRRLLRGLVADGLLERRGPYAVALPSEGRT